MSNSRRILVVFGTRPEAIKLAPVINELARRDDIEYEVCVTAQHRELLDQALGIFDIRPEYDLDLMAHAQSPSQVAAAALSRLEEVFDACQPDWVLVQGDTTTTAAVALAAHYCRVQVAHVEAGLRTGDRWQPFPEETNRRVVAAIADLHFPPTQLARDRLLEEGIDKDTIVVTGNTSIDALRQIVLRPVPEEVRALVGEQTDGCRLILLTLHRRESFGELLENICAAVRQLVAARPDILVLFPVHPNPAVHTPVTSLLSDVDGVRLVAPLGYASMVHLMKDSYIILTDSGGLQEEAPALDKPVLVLRERTERPEGVATGAARLVGFNPARIVQAIQVLLDDPEQYSRMSQAVNPYGDGHASRRIVQTLLAEPTDEFVVSGGRLASCQVGENMSNSRMG